MGSGEGQNRVAVIDPDASPLDAASGLPVMRDVLSILGPTFEAGNAGPMKAWCIDTKALDPATKSILVNSEDGVLYRWSLATNRFTQRIRLTVGLGEACTPTTIGADSAVYAIGNVTLFPVGRQRCGRRRCHARADRHGKGLTHEG